MMYILKSCTSLSNRTVHMAVDVGVNEKELDDKSKSVAREERVLLINSLRGCWCLL